MNSDFKYIYLKVITSQLNLKHALDCKCNLYLNYFQPKNLIILILSKSLAISTSFILKSVFTLVV